MSSHAAGCLITTSGKVVTHTALLHRHKAVCIDNKNVYLY